MNRLTPAGHCHIICDLPYAQDDRHTLDMYVPKNDTGQKPVLVFIHGGAWDEGHKDDYKFAGLSLSKMGYLTVVPNYRLYPQVQFPHFIEDVASAVAHLPTLLKQQGLQHSTPLEIVLLGHSAGAHTAAMLASNQTYLSDAKANVIIKGFIGLAGPYDLPLDDELVVGKFDGVSLHSVTEHTVDSGHEHNSHDANPINLATQNMANTLLIHGGKDVTVGPYHSERFIKRLKQLKVPCEHKVYKHTDHRRLVGGLCPWLSFLNPVSKDIRQFINQL